MKIAITGLNDKITGLCDKWWLVIEFTPEMLEGRPKSFRGFIWSTSLTWTEDRREAMQFESMAAAAAYTRLNRRQMEEADPT